jgi:hypothetical protein
MNGKFYFQMKIIDNVNNPHKNILFINMKKS